MQEESSLLRLLFPSDVEVEASEILDVEHELLPEERSAVERAVPKRVREFATGRVLCRRALRRLGRPAHAIPAGADRAPCWPAGVVGSIAHTDSLCCAVVAEGSRYRSLAIDAEPRRSLERELWPVICSPAELHWVREHGDERGGERALAVFVAKECAYKCQYPLTRTFLDFHDVGVRFDAELQGFTASFHDAGLQRHGLGELRGTLARSSRYVLASAWLPAAPLAH